MGRAKLENRKKINMQNLNLFHFFFFKLTSLILLQKIANSTTYQEHLDCQLACNIQMHRNQCIRGEKCSDDFKFLLNACYAGISMSDCEDWNDHMRPFFFIGKKESTIYFFSDFSRGEQNF